MICLLNRELRLLPVCCGLVFISLRFPDSIPKGWGAAAPNNLPTSIFVPVFFLSVVAPYFFLLSRFFWTRILASNALHFHELLHR